MPRFNEYYYDYKFDDGVVVGCRVANGYIHDQDDAMEILLSEQPDSEIVIRDFVIDSDEEREYGPFDDISYKVSVHPIPVERSCPNTWVAIREVAERFYDNFTEDMGLKVPPFGGDQITIKLDMSNRRASYEVKKTGVESFSACFRDDMHIPCVKIFSGQIPESLQLPSILHGSQSEMLALADFSKYSIIGEYCVRRDTWRIRRFYIVLQEIETGVQKRVYPGSDLYLRITSLLQASITQMNVAASSIPWSRTECHFVISPHHGICYTQHDYYSKHQIIHKSEGIDFESFADLCARVYPESGFEDVDESGGLYFETQWDSVDEPEFETISRESIEAGIYFHNSGSTYADAAGSPYDPGGDDPYYHHDQFFDDK